MEIKVWFLIPFIVLIILWIIAFFIRKPEYKRSRGDRWLFDDRHNYVFPEVVVVISIIFAFIFLSYLCIEVIDWQSSIYINI